MINVLVLCHGNINRSALSGEILKTMKGLNVVSAGFKNPGRRAAAKMRIAAKHFAIDLTNHRSQVVTKEQIEAANIVIYMDGGNLKRLREITPLPLPGQQWFCLGEFAVPPRKKIDDPHFIAKDNPKFVEIVEIIFHASMRLGKALIANIPEKEETPK
jgi:protein-tyrosine-phosphatase